MAAWSLDTCALCPQDRPPPSRADPAAGDAVGGDDLALGENHVPALQEGKGRGLPLCLPLHAGHLLALLLAPCTHSAPPPAAEKPHPGTGFSSR